MALSGLRIADMYITAMPVILSGILNMVFTKTGFYRRHRTPIDGGRCLSDGRRVFGDNKTWAGFLSMTVLCTAAQLFWGMFLKAVHADPRNELYSVYPNSVAYNAVIGFLSGAVYMLFELPNSFVKRRLDIEPGKTKRSALGACFFVIDQIDSLIGVMAVIYVFADISFGRYLGYVALGGLTHIAVNLVLYKLRIRRNV